MNDDIDKINAENDRQNNYISPGDQSGARNSKITTNEEDKKRSLAEGIISDLSNQRLDIDEIKGAIGIMGQQINQITQALNQGVQTQQAQGQPIEQGKGLNMESISALGDLLEKGAQAYKNLRGGNENNVDAFTQQITDNAKAEAIESLNIVHLINKKVKGKLVQDIAGDIAGNVINDSTKTNTHAPQ